MFVTISMQAQDAPASPANQSARQQANPTPLQQAGQKIQGSAAQTSEKASQSSSRIFGQSGDSSNSQGTTISQSAAKPESENRTETGSGAKRNPWSQQAAGQDTTDAASNTEQAASQRAGSQRAGGQQAGQSANQDTDTPKPSAKLPWHQRLADRSMKKKAEQKEAAAKREQQIKRVIIDPKTGLYVDSSLGTTLSGVSMSFDNRQEDLLDWGFWELDGRIGLVVDKDSYNGSLNWEQEGDALDFRFRGPLGFGGVRIHGDLGQEVRVKTTKGEEFFLQDIENDMQRQLGWSMPINSLRYWSLGITDPAQDAEVVINENDLLNELQQGEWKVVYDDYTDVDGVMLPRKFKITGPKTRIRMLVNEWTIPAAD